MPTDGFQDDYAQPNYLNQSAGEYTYYKRKHNPFIIHNSIACVFRRRPSSPAGLAASVLTARPALLPAATSPRAWSASATSTTSRYSPRLDLLE